MHAQEGSAYWGPWPQPEVSSEFPNATADAAGLVPYSRQMGSYVSLQTQVTPSNCITGNSYDASLPLATAYAPSPGYNTSTSLVASGFYEPSATAHSPYVPLEYHHRQPQPTIATSSLSLDQGPAHPQGAGESCVQEIGSPLVSVKPEPQQSPSPAAAARTQDVTPVLALDAPQSDNPVNNVLWVIQTKTGITSLANKLDSLSVTDQKGVEDRPVRLRARPTSKKAFRRQQKLPLPKRHCCGFTGCDKKFAQKAQLTAHIRVHTGEKPYHCRYGCGTSFAQPGNRTTHHRSHTGEAPYQCHICGKRFRSGGNLGPHIKTHSGVKDYVCRLDNCGKEISTKGNLKTHQTKYHSATLEALCKRLSQIKDIASASEEDRKMFEYMGSVHNNLNKGIKGCRGRKIRPIAADSRDSSAAASSPVCCYSDVRYETFGGHLQPYQQIPLVNLDPASGYSPAYGLAHQNITAQAAIHIDARMCHSDADSMASPCSTATYDEEEQQLIVARQCRF